MKTRKVDPVDVVRALIPTALQALGQGLFADLAPQLRQALAACPQSRRGEIDLPKEIWQPLVGPVVDRLGFEYVRARFADVDTSDAEKAAQALAAFWFECAAGEAGFDA